MPHVRPSLAQGAALVFDPAAERTQDIVVDTATGPRTVSDRFWQAVPCSSRPVDAAHQCLNLSAPVAIDGTPVDARTAPILLATSVVGYTPSSVAEAAEVGVAGGAAGPPAPEAATGANAMLARGHGVSLAQLALVAGFDVAEPGARGRTLVDAQGNHTGTAPAAITDLRAAVCYLRANAGRIPGNTDAIVSSGTSAGGAWSAPLGATGDAPDDAGPLATFGAAKASDAIRATGAWCPVTDLDRADMAHEWCWGGLPVEGGAPPDAQIAADLAAGFPEYQRSLGLSLPGGPSLAADSYPAHLIDRWLIPEATAPLAAMTDADRAASLAAHPATGWDGTTARFDWPGFRAQLGSRKGPAPATSHPSSRAAPPGRPHSTPTSPRACG